MCHGIDRATTCMGGCHPSREPGRRGERRGQDGVPYPHADKPVAPATLPEWEASPVAAKQGGHGRRAGSVSRRAQNHHGSGTGWALAGNRPSRATCRSAARTCASAGNDTTVPCPASAHREPSPNQLRSRQTVSRRKKCRPHTCTT